MSTEIGICQFMNAFDKVLGYSFADKDIGGDSYKERLVILRKLLDDKRLNLLDEELLKKCRVNNYHSMVAVLLNLENCAGFFENNNIKPQEAIDELWKIVTTPSK